MKWTAKEIDVLKVYFNQVSKEELMEMLPGRTWASIKIKAASYEDTKRLNHKYTSKELLDIQKMLEVGFMPSDIILAYPDRDKISIKNVVNRLKCKIRITKDEVNNVNLLHNLHNRHMIVIDTMLKGYTTDKDLARVLKVSDSYITSKLIREICDTLQVRSKTDIIVYIYKFKKEYERMRGRKC